MGNERIRYLVEGECEKKLIEVLKRESLIPHGKATVFNALTQRISSSRLMEFGKGSVVVLVFDTDGEQNDSILRKNIQLLEEHVSGIRIINLIQVENLEDELVRATDVQHIEELTNSRSSHDFKSDFLKQKNCFAVLKKHKFDIIKMWNKEPSGVFSCFEQQFSLLKKLKC